MHPAIAQGLSAGLAFVILCYIILSIARIKIPGLTIRGECTIIAVYFVVMVGALLLLG